MPRVTERIRSILFLFFLHFAQAFSNQEDVCEYDNGFCNEPSPEPVFHPMAFDLGDGEQVFDAYVVPDVSTFYQMDPGTKKRKIPKFNGLAGKFFNMSPEHMKLMWDAGSGQDPLLIAKTRPFTTVGTATFPGHNFFFVQDTLNPWKKEVRYRFSVTGETSLFVYDPFLQAGRPLESLTHRQREEYSLFNRTLEFSRQYKKFTGREWLSRYPRSRPRHFMWPADFFGQQHHLATKETHFTSMPEQTLLHAVSKTGATDEERQRIANHRENIPYLNLTLTVLSCAPRIFEVRNFLSDVETEHILGLAGHLSMSTSTVAGGTDGKDSSTRTSTNTWVYRHHTPIVDSIYRRAADLLKIDEALLRQRKPNEFPDYPSGDSPSRETIAEALQFVHYKDGQKYTPHHDFGYSPVTSPNQSARFATILIYLNEGMQGGQTTFPRYVNADTKSRLEVVPEKGKAVFFYSFLPDGNLDDLSQHSAEPVIRGEKWLVNLWVWDPIFSD